MSKQFDKEQNLAFPFRSDMNDKYDPKLLLQTDEQSCVSKVWYRTWSFDLANES